MLKQRDGSRKVTWWLLTGILTTLMLLIVHHMGARAIQVDDVARLPDLIGQRVEIRGVYSHVEKGGAWVRCGSEMIRLDDRCEQLGVTADDRVRISGVLWKWTPPANNTNPSTVVQGTSTAFFYLTDERVKRE